jgi:hypothetical protein
MYVKITYVDSATKIPCTKAPMTNGPSFPSLKGLCGIFGITEDLTNISISPDGSYETAPIFYGMCEDDADILASGFLGEISKEEYEAARETEHLARKPYPSWIGKPDTLDWAAPVPIPEDGKPYYWNEELLNWSEVPSTAI